MSLDIEFIRKEEIRCPHCHKPVTTKDIRSESSDGKGWFSFLEEIGYYIPFVRRSNSSDSGLHGEELPLTEKQIKLLIEFLEKEKPQNWKEIESLVAAAFIYKDIVIVRADW